MRSNAAKAVFVVFLASLVLFLFASLSYAQEWQAHFPIMFHTSDTDTDDSSAVAYNAYVPVGVGTPLHITAKDEDSWGDPISFMDFLSFWGNGCPFASALVASRNSEGLYDITYTYNNPTAGTYAYYADDDADIPAADITQRMSIGAQSPFRGDDSSVTAYVYVVAVEGMKMDGNPITSVDPVLIDPGSHTFAANTNPANQVSALCALVSWEVDGAAAETGTCSITRNWSAGTHIITAKCGTSSVTKTVIIDNPSNLKFDHKLPVSNLNNAAGPDRANIRWTNSNDMAIAYGDYVTLPAGSQWVIDTVRVWAVPDVPVSPAYHLGDHYSSVTLYHGGATGALSVAKTGNLTAGSNIATNGIVAIPVTYAGGSLYETASGESCHIWQIDFNDLNLLVTGGTPYVFGVNGVPRIDRLWFNHASNAALSGWSDLLADGFIMQFNTSNLSEVATQVTGAPWFGVKGSDINIQVFAHAQ